MTRSKAVYPFLALRFTSAPWLSRYFTTSLFLQKEKRTGFLNLLCVFGVQHVLYLQLCVKVSAPSFKFLFLCKKIISSQQIIQHITFFLLCHYSFNKKEQNLHTGIVSCTTFSVSHIVLIPSSGCRTLLRSHQHFNWVEIWRSGLFQNLNYLYFYPWPF